MAERYLKRLCDRSFLSLWSYPGVYKDQRQGGKGDGKEVCDLLVVFENHILIFSDKDCAFGDTGNLDLDWSRWYRRAVKKSADQVWGAERWIKKHPERLFLDRTCTQPFPIDLPDPASATFHRIVVAHGVSERCRQVLGGSGAMLFVPDIIGDAHCTPKSQGGMPFAIGQVDPSRGFVHVLDDASLATLMHELDTITDFVSYLSKKERLVLDGRLGMAAGEDDLLARYLENMNADGEHDFALPAGFDQVLIDEGHWSSFESSPQRRARLQANEVSYVWDRLIETFSQHMLAGTQYHSTHGEIRHGEKILRFLARESRTRRRMLAQSVHELIAKTPTRNIRASRLILPLRPGDPYYIFVLLPHPDNIPYDVYRKVRRELLTAYCLVVKLKHPQAMDIVGIATETGWGDRRSEDAMYYDARVFTKEDRQEAERLAEEFGLLKKTQMFRGMVREYPVPLQPGEDRMKGRKRNASCPCGSGRKYKRCCGQ
jgi:hypothetical protein